MKSVSSLQRIDKIRRLRARFRRAAFAAGLALADYGVGMFLVFTDRHLRHPHLTQFFFACSALATAYVFHAFLNRPGRVRTLPPDAPALDATSPENWHILADRHEFEAEQLQARIQEAQQKEQVATVFNLSKDFYHHRNQAARYRKLVADFSRIPADHPEG